MFLFLLHEILPLFCTFVKYHQPVLFLLFSHSAILVEKPIGEREEGKETRKETIKETPELRKTSMQTQGETSEITQDAVQMSNDDIVRSVEATLKQIHEQQNTQEGVESYVQTQEERVENGIQRVESSDQRVEFSDLSQETILDASEMEISGVEEIVEAEEVTDKPEAGDLDLEIQTSVPGSYTNILQKDVEKEPKESQNTDEGMFSEESENEEQLDEIQDVVKNLINTDANDKEREECFGANASDDEDDGVNDDIGDVSDVIDHVSDIEDEVDETNDANEASDDDEDAIEAEDQSHKDLEPVSQEEPQQAEVVEQGPKVIVQVQNAEEELQTAVKEKEQNALENVISEILGTQNVQSPDKNTAEKAETSAVQSPSLRTPLKGKRPLSTPSGPPEKRHREEHEECARTTPVRYQYRKQEDCARTTPRELHKKLKQVPEEVKSEEKPKPTGWRTKRLIKRAKKVSESSVSEDEGLSRLENMQHENEAIMMEVSAFELCDSPKEKDRESASLSMLESSALEMQNDSSDEDIEKTFAEMTGKFRPAPMFKFPEVKPEVVKAEPLKDELKTPRGPPPVQRLVLGSKLSLGRLNLPMSSALPTSSSLYNDVPLTPRTSITQHGVRIRLPQQNPLVTAPVPGPSSCPSSYPVQAPAVVTTSVPRFPFHPPPQQQQQTQFPPRRRRHISETKVTMQMTSTMHSETEPEPQYQAPLVQCTSPTRYIDTTNRGNYLKTYQDTNRMNRYII